MSINKEILIDIPKTDDGWYRLVVYTDGTYMIDKERGLQENVFFKWAISVYGHAIFYEGNDARDCEFLGSMYQRKLVYKAWKQLQDDIHNILINSTESTNTYSERNNIE